MIRKLGSLLGKAEDVARQKTTRQRRVSQPVDSDLCAHTVLTYNMGTCGLTKPGAIYGR